MASMTVQHARNPLPNAAALQNSVVAPQLTSTPSSQARAISKAGKDIKAEKEAQRDFGKVKILVAEDNKVNQEVILRMLKLEKIFDVTIACDGQEALDLVKAHTPPTGSAAESIEDDPSTPVQDSSAYDLIFMDVQMPRLDGISSTKLIRQHGYSGPIVALTAYAEKANMDGCYAAGMDYFLAKPIKRPLLRKVLTDYCSGTQNTNKQSPMEPETTVVSSESNIAQLQSSHPL